MKNHYQGRTKQLQAEIDEILSYVTHDTSRGHHAEEVFKEFLKDELANRYEIDSGFVFTPQDTASKQIDIIIHDSFYSPPLQSMRGFKTFPAESVYSAIAVKIPLSTESLISGDCNAMENIESVKTKPKDNVLTKKTGNMISFGKSDPTIGCVFAFRTDTKLDTLKENLIKFLIIKKISIDEYSERYADLICGLDSGIIIANPKKYGFNSDEDFLCLENDDSLMNFVLALHTMLNKTELRAVNLSPYMSD